MTRVELDELTKQYPATDHPAVDALSLDIEPGRITGILGPSGCGKTTTLRMIAGLLPPTSGDIRFDDESVLDIAAERRSAVMVFQEHVLFPYMDVAHNVGFGLRMRGVDRDTIRRKVAEMLELVQLPDIGDRSPSQLSGGQRQRVALARALITNPRVLLLDEPLSNLDAHLRDEMRSLILNIQQELEITTIMVTHDQQDALLLAHKIALIFEGVLQQYCPPQDFYRCPATERVARFFGGVNFLPGHWTGDRVETAMATFDVELPPGADIPPGRVTLTVRPEHVHLGPRGKSASEAPNACAGRIVECIYLGTHTRCKVQVDDHTIEATSGTDAPVAAGEGGEVSVHLPADRIWLLPDAGADT